MLKRDQLFNFLTIFFILIVFILAICIVNLKTQLWPSKKLSNSCPNCNIVIIDIDILRADALECNTDNPNAPNICQLSKTASYFKNHISHSDLTRPSFISGLTSLYSSSHNAWNEMYNEINDEIVLLSEILKKNTYSTIFIGTLTEQISTDGFKEVIDIPGILDSEFKPDEIINNLKKKQPFLLYFHTSELHFPYLLGEYSNNNNQDLAPKNIPTTWKEYDELVAEYIINHNTDIFTQEAINSHPELFQGNIKEKKESIYIFFKEAANTPKTKAAFIKNAWKKPKYDSVMNFIDVNNQNHIQYLKSNYQELLTLIDNKLASLLNTFNTPKFANNTIIIIKSDHGEEFYEHGSFSHNNNLYQELIHIPLIIKTPSNRPVEINSFSQDIDIMPTLLDLIDIDIPLQAQGKSLVSLMEGSKTSVNQHQIAQKAEGSIASFRKGDLKLIMKDFRPFELYDLLQDPKEKNNLIDLEEKTTLLLYEEYNQIINSQKKYSNPASSIIKSIDKQKRERLIKEGYF